MANDWKKWVIVLGGVVAVVGQFWPAGAANSYYLPLIGGAVAAVVELLPE